MQNEIPNFIPGKRHIRELKLKARWPNDRVKLPPRGLTLLQAISNGFTYQVAVVLPKKLSWISRALLKLSISCS